MQRSLVKRSPVEPSLFCRGPLRESGVSLATIHRAESADGQTAMTLANASAIRRALENAGVELIEENGGGPGARLMQRLEFIDENGGGPGVRLRKPAKR